MKLGQLSFVLSAFTATTYGAAISRRATDAVGAVYSQYS